MGADRQRYKVVLGRAEPVTFVDLGLDGVPAKVDTGAYRSAIHARNVILSHDGKTLSFELLGGHPLFTKKIPTLSTSKFREVEIENSFGQSEKRFEVKLKVLVGGQTFKAGFTLANRGQKDYPILLGRTMLNKRFMVDTSLTNVNRAAIKRERLALSKEED
jgi:hypothetical protein